jgi:capsular polysaccharide biosynthesis protein
MVDLADLDARHKDLDTQHSQIAMSRDSVADQISAAGLDVTLEVVGEKRPDRPVTSTFALVLVMCVVATAALIGSAMVVSSFDPRVHDTDDVARLGLPVLGHVPAFAGDRVGSLRQRGARRNSGARQWH